MQSERVEIIELDKDELLQAIRVDCVTFFGFYLGDELTLAVPDLHIQVWDELLAALEQINMKRISVVIRKLFAIPRGFAKSTIAKLAVILLLKYTYMNFVLYVSKTNGHAKNAIRDIMIWLTSDSEAELFGKAIIEKSSETESLWIMQIATRTSASAAPIYKRVIFKALGADQQVRGLNILNRRPQIIIIDDIEDNDNTTVELQPKLDTWLLGSLLKSFASEAFVLFIGNMIRQTTLLARLSKDPKWNPTVFGSIVRVNGVIASLWEEKFPLQSLLDEYESFRRLGQGHVWEAEMMNLTAEEILAKDLKNVVRPPRPSPEELTAGCLILDPAFGKDSYHDDSGITVHAQIRGIKIPCIIDHWKGKATPEQLLDEMIRLAYYWGITTWFIESAGAQKLYISLFNLLLSERRIPEGTILMIPIPSGGVAKPSRILAFRTVVSTGSYGICDSEQQVLDELAAYDPAVTKHDDLPDSAAYGTIAWANHGSTIESQGVQHIGLAIKNNRGPRSGGRTESQIVPF